MSKTCTVIILVNFFILGGAAIFIAWLADRIKFPQFDIDQAALNGFNLTNDNIFSVNFIFIVRSHNRDSKYTIFYDHIAVSVYHDNYSLAYETLGHFAENDRRDDIVFTSHPVARDVLIKDDRVAENIRNESKLTYVDFEVVIRVFVRFECKGWKRKQYLLKSVCAPLVIDLHTGKSLKRTDCYLDNYQIEK
ncbi:hypothetical protein vseg_015397 [Gypsophila vaccaria]